MLPLVVIEAVAIVLLGLLVSGLLRSHAEILRRLHNLGAGLDPDEQAAVGLPEPRSRRSSSAATDVGGVTVDDEPVQIGVVGAHHPTLLAFLSTGCLTCTGFWTAFGSDRLKVPGGARLVIVTKGGGEESESRLRQLAPPEVPLVRSNQAWEDYSVAVAPYFVYVEGSSGRVLGEGAAQTWDQVKSLLSQAIDDANGRQGEARADLALAHAGIFPGDPSLYPRSGDGHPPGEDRQ